MLGVYVPVILWDDMTSKTCPCEQDAVNSYAFKLAPKRAEADVLSHKPMWASPFPVAAHSRNRFYQAVSFSFLNHVAKYCSSPPFTAN